MKMKMTDITVMGFKAFLKLLTKLFTFLSWPSFTLVYILYASVRAIDSDCPSKNNRCLCYWVLFALLTIWESLFAKILRWFPFWPYTRGIILLFLIIPSFGGSSYVYKQFIKSYIIQNSVIWKWIAQTIDSIPRGRSISSIEEEESVDDEVEKNYFGSQELQMEVVEFQMEVTLQSGLYSSIKENSEVLSEIVRHQGQVQPSSQKSFQKEWCCALCVVITTSKNCLASHLQGKKHKAKEEELRVSKQAKKSRHRYYPICLLDYLNQIATDSIILPVARSIGWCRWEKPEFGWTKLNTDGSMTNKRASLGGLLRDYKGDPICAFVTKAPRDDVFSVELWAIWRGLVLALGLGIKVIWIESDSLNVVKTVDRKIPFDEKALTCLNHIWEILEKFDAYKISHSWRETNKAADRLAKMVVLGSDKVLWPVDFPQRLLNIIKDDAKGTIYHRGS